MNLDTRSLFLDVRVYLATRAMEDCVSLMNSCIRHLRLYGDNRRVRLIYFSAGIALAAHVAAGHRSEVQLLGVKVYRPASDSRRIVGRSGVGRSYVNDFAANA